MLNNVIWDLDGTLYDTYPGILTALIATLAKFGVTAERAALFTTIKHGSVRGELARIGKTIGVPYDTLWADYHDREVSGFVMQAQAYPDTARGVARRGGRRGPELLDDAPRRQRLGATASRRLGRLV